MTKFISTISSAVAGAMLANDILGAGAINAVIGALSVGGVGYSIAFIAIPRLLENKMLGIASSIGLIMSLTWLANGSTVYSFYFNNLCNKIDAKYMTYKKIYNESDYKTINLTSKEKEKNKLLILIDKEKLKIASLEAQLSKDGEYYKRIQAEVKNELLAEKNNNLKAWRAGKYIEFAKGFLCQNPTQINFSRLLTCGTEYRFNKSNRPKIEELKETREELNSNKISLREVKSEIETSKESISTANLEIDMAKKKYLAIEKQAEVQADNIKIYIYMTVWAFGLFIELVSMMFNELLEARKAKMNEKEEITSIEKMKEEIEEVYETVVKREFKRENMNRMIAYANNPSDPLRVKMKTRLKNGNLGKELAVSNAILGAFLYVYTIKKDKIIESWEELTLSNILFVNGANGTEFVNKRERRKLISEYMTNIDDEACVAITVLGSTATELKNKDIRAYLNDRNGSINPQQEALTYLRNLELSDEDRFKPQRISIRDLETVALNFTKRYHPNNFK